ncbi:glycine zipper 2TM domain-containing protein [Marinimicrobium alkaliphilum]|uniref:glycine zipper 2TM domain-containing protein n=1 Tax=Marinimicrobium alkaliphilum TaxID=2202654 RepID=UPI000DBA5695|nr:YMGG-like glycine zipper-containing protein [Marinimicrobium alkaliphilum]
MKKRHYSRFSLSLAGTLLAASLLTQTAHAAPPGHQYGRVVDAQPIYQTRSHRVPYQACHIETRAHRTGGTNRDTVTVVGGLLGAAVGHELGNSRRNKQVGAAAGGLLGAAIARDATRNRAPATTRYRDHEVCQTHYRTEHSRELVGYNVTYRYQGRLYETRTRQHPGGRIPVTVSVRPARRY